MLTARPASNVLLSSFLNSYVHGLPAERKTGRKNEWKGGVGWGGGEVGNWDMKKRGERINHQVRRTTPPDWKNSRGFSLFYSRSLFLSLYFSHRSPFFFLTLSFLCALQIFRESAHIHTHTAHTLHTCMHTVIFFE